MIRAEHSPARILLVAALFKTIAGCAVGPEPVAPPLYAPTDYVTTVDLEQLNVGSPWWESFQDPTLTGLINTALKQNLALQIARTQLREARAFRRAARSDLLPSLDAFVDTQLATELGADPVANTNNNSGAVFFFNPDLFSRNRRAAQVAQAQLHAAALNADDVARLTAQTVAERYIEIRRASVRLQLLETALDLQKRTLEIVESRYRAGLSPKLDVDRSAADLARTNAQRGNLLESRQTASFALSVLLASEPQNTLSLPSDSLEIPGLAAGPGLGVPADLVRKRPDVRAAEAQLVASIALIGVETADLYPRLTLPGVLRADLGASGSIANTLEANLSAVLDLPFLDGGRRRAEVSAARARADAALLNYRQALLRSLLEVESALVRISTLQYRLARLAESVEFSRSAFEQLNALYREGLATFIDVLDVQRTLIASREDQVDTEAAIATAVVGLYSALGATPSDFSSL